jgi:hypothetical protein
MVQGIEGIEAQRALRPLDGEFRLSHPGQREGTETKRESIAAEGEGTIEQSKRRGAVVL